MILAKSGNKPDAAVPKVISPTVHGIIDYCHAAFFFTVGVLCARSHNKAAARAAFATSGFILVQSLLTDYRFGYGEGAGEGLNRADIRADGGERAEAVVGELRRHLIDVGREIHKLKRSRVALFGELVG